MRNPVVVVLYRHLARLARMHDRDPALKTLLVLGHTLEYHSHGAQWVTREVDQQRGLHAVGCAFFAGGNIYRPTRSLQDFVRVSAIHVIDVAADDREFYKTGIDNWDELFGGDDQ